ncbi:uncharacterized protein AC631_00589 [Debaryomyces fabryi]|uniref:Anaphase-promoting complex subunit 5 n=1 Tax=Debaryomyces fabryi TaxID=58627 RepID=A0A0V1Q521_9ASCO|nr:uncharacterized protein AC631_00589 [Debaryomyces fabryi]KSA03614.1 hypothetical protein AC631_00589 [Debaryomyces fabryi]CUM52725.1 unnamed protein product [Debaryomyces fabryi]
MPLHTSRIKLLLTEDLSPHKISLLILVVLYCTDFIRENRLQAVLTTIVRFLENDLVYNEKKELVVLPELRDLCFILKQSIISDSNSGSVESKLAAEEDANDIQKKLLQALWNINSVESLDSHIKRAYCILLGSAVVTVDEPTPDQDIKKLISPRSLLGSFIQKIVTTFRLLHFDEELLLYEAFVDYREPSRALYVSNGGNIQHYNNRPIDLFDSKRKLLEKPAFAFENAKIKEANGNNENDEILFNTLKTQLNESLGVSLPTPSQSSQSVNLKLLPVPKHDIQVLLDKQISLLEVYGTETPKLLRDVMSLMTSPNSNTCLIQNTTFNNLPSYYYVNYLECLHDLDYEGAFQSLHQYFDYMVSNNSKYFYHFALISRASLHQFFGEDEKALDAIQEAISVARENKDNSTLTYILSWLFNFMKNKPELWNTQTFYHNNNEQHLLDFLVNKTQSVSLLLYAMSYHFETLHVMNNGGPLNKYLESLLKATYISINDELPTFIKSVEMIATVWSRIGNPHLCSVYTDIGLECTKDTGNLSDELSIEIRKSYLEYYSGDTEIAYSKLEALKHKTVRDQSLYKMLQLRTLIMLVKIALKKGRFKFAQKIMETLSNNEIQEIELKAEMVYLHAEVETALGNFSKALNYISSNLSRIESQHSKTQTNLHTIIRLNLLKCYIFNKSGAHSRAISLIIQQIQHAKQTGFKTLVVEGLIILISILNNMECYEDSYQILSAIMPEILMVENKEYTSTAYFEFAKTCFRLSFQDQLTALKLNVNEKQLLNRFLKFLNTSISGFRQSLNLEMLKECFKLEKDMADMKQLDELQEHSAKSLEKLRKRALEEADYGFVLNNNKIEN